jgi:2-polyprenyl-3-methyl-5-hydroxy-6-metoxy-1,4-benzoquinol methylase
MKINQLLKNAVLVFPPVKKLQTKLNNLQNQLTLANKIIQTYYADKCKANKIHPNDYLLDFLVKQPSITGLESAIDYYITDGKDSVLKLKSLCEEFLRPPVSLLEFASGYGRVTRHFDKDYFDVTACDIHNEATNFVSENFNVKTVLSTQTPDEFDIGKTYDVVFALSFFSHMPDRFFGKWIKALYKHVKPGGILVFTTHGRISNESFRFSLNNGFSFSLSSEQQDLSEADYGIAVSEYSYVEKVCENFISKKPDVWKEGFWWTHQDLYIIRK